MPSTSAATASLPTKPTRLGMLTEKPDSDSTYLVYDPAAYDRCQLLLVVDSREGISRGRTRTICQHLEKQGVAFEERPLSVGDYLWLMRMENGREMVMDYVIERKTWDDLKVNSISN